MSDAMRERPELDDLFDSLSGVAKRIARGEEVDEDYEFLSSLECAFESEELGAKGSEFRVRSMRVFLVTAVLAASIALVIFRPWIGDPIDGMDISASISVESPKGEESKRPFRASLVLSADVGRSKAVTAILVWSLNDQWESRVILRNLTVSGTSVPLLEEPYSLTIDAIPAHVFLLSTPESRKLSAHELEQVDTLVAGVVAYADRGERDWIHAFLASLAQFGNVLHREVAVE